MKNRKFAEVAIIGGGPAGCSAAIQLKRSRINPLVFEKNQLGGLARNANLIENYLGFPEGITGRDFAPLLEKHMQKLEIEVIYTEITNIDWEQNSSLFLLNSSSEQFSCRFLILATGTIPKRLSVPGEEQLFNSRLLFYEPVNLPKEAATDSEIAIIGGGDASFDYALYLVEKNNQITIFHKSDSFRCLPLLLNRVKQKSRIRIEINKSVKQFFYQSDDHYGEKKVRIEFTDGSNYEVDRVLIAIGRDPNLILYNQLPPQIRKNERLFQIGDITNRSFRQISIATGDGIRCAMEISSIINQKLE